jgi:thiamine biosynthesis protein ThiI
MEQSVVIRFSEITLKGGNRHLFERRMAENIARHLKAHGAYRLKRQHARMEINGGGDLGLAVRILKGLPGVANLSIAHSAPRELPALTQACVDFIAGMQERAGGVRPCSFALDVQRKDKRYPLPSMEVATRVGQAVRDRFPQLTVNLTRPDLLLHVEIMDDRALLFEEKIPGPGGLAVGSSGKAICLQSAGIDSPVAAYLLMTRGVTVVHLNFHSFPFIGEQSKEKVRQVVRFLARYQPASRLYVAPFAEIQTAIRDHCPESLRTILYRRMMNRVANGVAARENALALVTGESVGQVASQTLENLRAIHETAALPVLQPLIGMSKPEIIRRAQHIGTFPISIQPYPDCCTLFQPDRPETKAKLTHVHRAERALPIEALVAACMAGLEVTDYGPEFYAADWDA